jgi:hypothetical protein
MPINAFMLSCTPQEDSAEVNIRLGECLSPEIGGCQDQLRVRVNQQRAGCLQILIDRELTESIGVRWRESGGLNLERLPTAELNEDQQIRAGLYLSAGPSELDCDALDNLIETPCAEISSCAIKLKSPTFRFSGEALEIDFRDGQGLCDREMISMNVIAENPGDGIDNNCNGEVDEAEEESCFIGMGSCRREGVLQRDDQGRSRCQVPAVSDPELCNDGIDNDCDGLSDEGFIELGQPCTPLGEAEFSGRYICSVDDRTQPLCRSISIPGEVDLCDGINDDGDGRIDEDAPPVEITCEASPNPEVRCDTNALTLCEDGELISTCMTEPMSDQGSVVSDESQDPSFLCDGRDNDCDGVTDEDFIGEELDATCGEGSCATRARTSCERSTIVERCVPLDPQAEVCDGEDNDCDGVVDNVLPSDEHCGACGRRCADEGEEYELYTCQRSATGDPECQFSECAMGYGEDTETGALCGCMLNSDGICCTPSDEVCNNLDDDCDGVIDEGPTQACSICLTNDICDGLDDDCDGVIDEGDGPQRAPGKSCGQMWMNQCKFWLKHERSILGVDEVVADGVTPTSSNRFFTMNVSLRSTSQRPSSNAMDGDTLTPMVDCGASVNEVWRRWMDQACKLTVIWGDRDDINPWNCYNSGLNAASSSCNHSSMMTMNRVTQTLDPLHVALTCRVADSLSEADKAIHRARIIALMTNFSLRFGAIENTIPPMGMNCPITEASVGIPINRCRESSAVICGDQTLDESGWPSQMTRWSTLDGLEELNRCSQLTFGQFDPNEVPTSTP